MPSCLVTLGRNFALSRFNAAAVLGPGPLDYRKRLVALEPTVKVEGFEGKSKANAVYSWTESQECSCLLSK